jgi:hypothetical protein
VGWLSQELAGAGSYEEEENLVRGGLDRNGRGRKLLRTRRESGQVGSG